jgi:mRNA turnover protein 4
MEPYVRTKLGLPTSVKNGIVHLEKEHTVCNEGDILTPEQAKILVNNY